MFSFHWIAAERAAQLLVSLPDFSLPAGAHFPGVMDEHSSLLKLYYTTVNGAITN